VAEVVDVLLMGKSSEVPPVPSPIRLDSNEAELDSTLEAVPHTICPSFSVVSVIVVQPFGSIVFPSPAAVSVGRLSARQRHVPHPGLLSWDTRREGEIYGITEIYRSCGVVSENRWASTHLFLLIISMRRVILISCPTSHGFHICHSALRVHCTCQRPVNLLRRTRAF
jgi:hypothetical protein